MHALRAIFRGHHRLAFALVALSLLIKAIMPSGYMFDSAPGASFTVTICSAGMPNGQKMTLAVPAGGDHSKQSDAAKKETHCAFSGLGKTAVAGADPALLALALAFILLLGFVAVDRLPVSRPPYLFPPRRGPPLGC